MPSYPTPQTKAAITTATKWRIRYASDRIENNGIVAFVTNGSFIDGNADSGLRACLEAEFDYIYIFNLRGDINKNMQNKTSGEGENIFGSASKTPTAISVFVKCKDTVANEHNEHNAKKATIYYLN